MRQAINRWWDTNWPLILSILMLVGSLALIALATTLDFVQP